MTSQFLDMTSSPNFLTFSHFSLKFGCWSKFHVNIITASGVIAIFSCIGLTRNPEIRNIPIWLLPNIWWLGPVRETNFGTNVSNEMLLNAWKCQGSRFYRLWVIKGKPIGGAGKITPSPPSPQPRLGLMPFDTVLK